MKEKDELLDDLMLVCAQYRHALKTEREDSIQRFQEMIEYFKNKWNIPEDPDSEDPCDKWRNCGFQIWERHASQTHFRIHRLSKVRLTNTLLPQIDKPIIDSVEFKNYQRRVTYVAFIPGTESMPSIAFDALSGERLEVVCD